MPDSGLILDCYLQNLCSYNPLGHSLLSNSRPIRVSYYACYLMFAILNNEVSHILENKVTRLESNLCCSHTTTASLWHAIRMASYGTISL